MIRLPDYNVLRERWRMRITARHAERARERAEAAEQRPARKQIALHGVRKEG